MHDSSPSSLRPFRSPSEQASVHQDAEADERCRCDLFFFYPTWSIITVKIGSQVCYSFRVAPRALFRVMLHAYKAVKLWISWCYLYEVLGKSFSARFLLSRASLAFYLRFPFCAHRQCTTTTILRCPCVLQLPMFVFFRLLLPPLVQQIGSPWSKVCEQTTQDCFCFGSLVLFSPGFIICLCSVW